MYAQIIRCAIGLVAEGKTDIHQSATPTATGQLIGSPVYIHRKIKIAGVDAVNPKRLLVAGWRVQHLLIVHKPTIKVAIARIDARILLGFERALLYQLLPHAIVGTEVDVLKKLSVKHLIDDARRLFALNGDLILTLGTDS